MGIPALSVETQARILEMHLGGRSARSIAGELGIGVDSALRYGAKADGMRPKTFAEALAPLPPLPQPERRDFWAPFNVLHDDGRTLELADLPENVLFFSCTQSPLEHQDFLPFLAMVQADIKPDLVIMMGDFADFTFGSPKFVGPDDLSPTSEIDRVREFVNAMRRVIKNMICLSSNHLEGRISKMQKGGNIPSAFLRKWQDVIGFPDSWVVRDYVVMRNWLCEHGHDISKGSRPSIREETIRRFGKPYSVMRAHRHNLFGEVMVPEWETPTQQRRLCYVGCGMDADKVNYTRSGLWNGCIHLYRGVPIPIPMERDKSNRWTGKLSRW